MPVTRPAMHQGGFTLLEMLLSLTLLGLLLVGLFAAFSTVGRGWDAVAARMEQVEDMRLLSDFLRRQLGQAMAVRIKGEDQPQVYAFAGTAQQVRYVAPMQPLQHQGGVFLLELTVADGKQGKGLQLRYAPYRPDLTWEEAFQDAEPVPVYEGLKAAEFAYFGATEHGKEPEWLDKWEEGQRYPALLKLTLADPQQVWPELVVALPQVGGNAAP